MPNRIQTQQGNHIDFLYDATGRKWAKKGIDNHTRMYIGNIEYFKGKLEHIAFPDGRLVPEYDENDQFLGTYRPEYFRTDHLGNTRLIFSDFNRDMIITTKDDPETLEDETEITAEHHYYPFGLSHAGPWYASVAPENKYRYNGKEWNEDGGLDLYDFGNRWQDPTLGRFTTVDRFAEKYAFQSAYVMAANDPMKFVDVNGDSIKIGAVAYIPRMQQSDEYDEFTNNSIEALNFILDNGGKKHINKLAASDRIYKVKNSNELGTNTFEPISDYGGEIKFNDKEAIEYADGKIMTAVTILAHEIEHAFKNETLVEKAIKTGNFDKLYQFQSPEPDSKAKVKEENRAMKGLERKIASVLNQHIRSSYDEKPVDRFTTSGPLKKI
ncbi:MAG: RHS repeat-associated core domain-containing protein [Saprospiraceae bacterium]|nr:RHS repeat-associated core domain-containing protein [Saprospiraceae bacterium]